MRSDHTAGQLVEDQPGEVAQVGEPAVAQGGHVLGVQSGGTCAVGVAVALAPVQGQHLGADLQGLLPAEVEGLGVQVLRLARRRSRGRFPVDVEAGAVARPLDQVDGAVAVELAQPPAHGQLGAERLASRRRVAADDPVRLQRLERVDVDRRSDRLAAQGLCELHAGIGVLVSDVAGGQVVGAGAAHLVGLAPHPDRERLSHARLLGRRAAGQHDQGEGERAHHAALTSIASAAHCCSAAQVAVQSRWLRAHSVSIRITEVKTF